MTKRYRLDPSQALTQIIRDEDARAVAALQSKLRDMSYNERVDHLIRLFSKAKQDPDLIPVIKKAVSGRFLLELQDAEKKYTGHALRARPQKLILPQSKPGVTSIGEIKKSDVMSTEEMRKRLGKKFHVSNPIQDDAKFITDVLLPKFKVKAVRLRHSSSKRKWPDIWVDLKKIPIITVTDEWMRQDKEERRKRLVHEFLHLKGMSHGKKNGLMYSTHPEEDSYSRSIYKLIMQETK